jgi:hypothetical protein
LPIKSELNALREDLAVPLTWVAESVAAPWHHDFNVALGERVLKTKAPYVGRIQGDGLYLAAITYSRGLLVILEVLLRTTSFHVHSFTWNQSSSQC